MTFPRLSTGKKIRFLPQKYTQEEMFGIHMRFAPLREHIATNAELNVAIGYQRDRTSPYRLAMSSVHRSEPKILTRAGDYVFFRRDLPFGSEIVMEETGIKVILNVPDIQVSWNKADTVRSTSLREAQGVGRISSIFDLRYERAARIKNTFYVSIVPSATIRVMDISTDFALPNSFGYPDASKSIDGLLATARHFPFYHDQAWHGSVARSDFFPGEPKMSRIITRVPWQTKSAVMLVED